MNTDQIKLTFDSSFVGEMTSPKGTIKIGNQDGGMKPYHLLYGALGSCFYATFLSVSQKMKLSFSDVSIEVIGNKRAEVPTTLDYVKITMTIYNASDEQKLNKAAKLGAKYCSIHETISKVTDIELDINFKTK